MATPERLPKALTQTPFAVADALNKGIRKRRLYRSDLARPFNGVRTTDDPSDDLKSLCAAYAARMRPVEFFSHSTSALLHGIWIPLEHQSDIRLHISVIAPNRAVRAAGTIGHQLMDRPGLQTQVGDFRVAGRVETWAQLGSMLSLDALVAAGDSLIAAGRSNPGDTVDHMRLAAQGEGRRGVHKLRTAIELIRSGVRSAAETRLRLLIFRAGLPEPEVNLRLYSPDGRFLAECDLVFTSQRVVLEYEGDYHRTDIAKFRSDIHRRELLDDYGWHTIRITADDLSLRPLETISRIRTRLTRPTSP